jgi:hypothetical protein
VFASSFFRCVGILGIVFSLKRFGQTHTKAGLPVQEFALLDTRTPELANRWVPRFVTGYFFLFGLTAQLFVRWPVFS